jgi:hypothetical protein
MRPGGSRCLLDMALVGLGSYFGSGLIAGVLLLAKLGQGSGVFGDKTAVLLPLLLGSPSGSICGYLIARRTRGHSPRWTALASCIVSGVLGIFGSLFLLDRLGGNQGIWATPLVVGVCAYLGTLWERR